MCKVLVLSKYYLPGYKAGGPIRSLANMVSKLDDEVEIKIITTDRDFGNSQAYPNIHVNCWNPVGKAEVLYLAPNRLTLKSLQKAIRSTPHDVLYLNSCFSPVFSIKPLLLRKLGLIPIKPVILAPRGEFSRGALSLKRLKKRVFIAAARRIRLYQGIVWQATTEYEKNYILQQFGKDIAVSVVPNLVSFVPGSRSLERDTITKNKGKMQVVFLSRISPKKNLAYALKLLASVKGEVKFDIYGVITNLSYWRRCQSQIQLLPGNIHVSYRGPIPHSKVLETMGNYHLFFLPTKGENFGHAIAEALLAGCPVLISDQTPWRRLEQSGVGWDVPLDRPELFTALLQRVIDMDASEFEAISRNAKRYGMYKTDDSRVGGQYLELFKRAVSHEFKEERCCGEERHCGEERR